MRKTDMKEHAAGIRITVYITKVLVEGTSVLKSYQAALPARRGFAAVTSGYVKLSSRKKSTIGLFVLFTLWYNLHIATHQAAP